MFICINITHHIILLPTTVMAMTEKLNVTYCQSAFIDVYMKLLK